jgi:hypothetical protein
MIQCEECICLAICMNSIDFKFDPPHGGSFNYHMELKILKNKCEEIEKCTETQENWNRFKEFFLKKKGLI